MTTNRLEAFSDGVLAIIITIMILNLKLPQGSGFSDILPVLPRFLIYLFSFIYVGIYWNNHHHLLQITQKINGSVLWANLHLLFWLSLLPIATGWVGETSFARNPVALYGFILLMSAISWKIMTWFILKNEGKESKLFRAYQNDRKQYLSIFVYLVGIVLAFVLPLLSIILYAFVAIIWFVPDKRIEKNLE